jgi:uncharacterized protein
MMDQRPEIIIADASSLIVLYETDLLDLLQKIYFSVTITKHVAKEIKFEVPDWVKIADASDTQILSLLLTRLDEGEASSIALAIEHKNSLLIIDEKDGRKIAASFHIQIIGTLAVLLQAKRMGFIQSFKECLYRLTDKGFRVSQKLIEAFLRETGEE